jgi:hypothetical protein
MFLQYLLDCLFLIRCPKTPLDKNIGIKKNGSFNVHLLPPG